MSATIDGKAELLPRISSAREAADVVAQNVGQDTVRFGITRYPVGIGDAMALDIDEKLFEPCRNVAIGTELFAGIYDAVAVDTNAGSQAHFEKAVGVYLAGDGRPVRDSGAQMDKPEPTSRSKPVEVRNLQGADDPFKAGICVEIPKNMD